MSVSITSSCIACGACLWECPTEAIAAGRPHPVVDEARCVECHGFFPESQCMVVCPVQAIVARCEPPAQLLHKFAGLYPDRVAVDTADWRPAA